LIGQLPETGYSASLWLMYIPSLMERPQGQQKQGGYRRSAGNAKKRFFYEGKN